MTRAMTQPRNPDALITIAVYANDWQAHIAKNLLEEAGIPCIIDNGVMSSIYPLGFSDVGSLRLKVRQADAPQARHILAGADING